MAVGGGGEWMLTGNAGTVDGTDFIGTTDSTPLNFKVNSQKAGRISSSGHTIFGYRAGDVNTGTNSSAFGYQALNKNTNGAYNTALGAEALFSNVNGGENTAVGANALYSNATGSKNVAIGRDALRASTSSENTAVGYKALVLQTSGSQNTAFGSLAMQSNLTGVANTAIGAGAQNYNTGGNYNVCVGGSCLWRLTTGQKNVGMGVWAMANGVMTGEGNTAIGHQAGYQISSGFNNIMIGESAGMYVTTGSSNLVIGRNAGSSISTQNHKMAIEMNAAEFPSTPLIAGDFASTGRFVTINGKLGIGTSTPGTPSTPTIATAGVTKLHVTGGSTILDQEAWQPLTLASGWSSCTWPGAVPPMYFKDSVGVVHLKGCIRRSATLPAYGGTAFVMPVGYRASNHGSWQGPIPKTQDGYGPTAADFCMLMHVFTMGEVSISAIGTTNQFTATSNVCHLTGVTWRADL